MLWGNRLYRMFIKPTKFHNTALLFGSSMARFVSRCKITTFPQTRKGMGDFSLFTKAPAAMSSLRWPVRWHGIYGCDIFRPFSLMRKGQRIKADIKGLPHQATAPPPCRPGPRTLPGRSLALPHITNYLSDNKRLQSTTNVCSTA